MALLEKLDVPGAAGGGAGRGCYGELQPHEVAAGARFDLAKDGGSHVRANPRMSTLPRGMKPGALRTTFTHWFAVAGSNRVRWEGDGGPCAMTEKRGGVTRRRPAGLISLLF